jgi:hypothetical protein
VTGTGVILSGSYTGSIAVGTGLYVGSGVLTVSAITSGVVQIGQLITGTGIAAGTYVTGNISSTAWTVNNSQTTTSTTITGNGFVSITSPATATSSSPITFSLISGYPAIQLVCVDDNNQPSTIGNAANGDHQPRFISMKGLTVQTATGTNTCLQFDAVRDSTFEDLKLTGGNAGTSASFNNNSTGIALNALSSLRTCENNVFKNIVIDGFTLGVYSYQDILNNTFDNCQIKNSYQGFTLGYVYYSQFIETNYYISNTNLTGQTFGPRQTQINNCKFYNVYKRAVFLGLGYSNSVRSPKLLNVGNNNAGAFSPTVPQIYFYSAGNTIENVFSDRTFSLSSSSALPNPYIPESTGWLEVKSFGILNKVTLGYSAATTTVGSLVLGQLYTIAALGSTTNTQWNTIAGTSSQTYLAGSQFVCANIGTGLGNGTVYTPQFAFRLPVSTDEAGAPNGSSVYTIDYSYVSTSKAFVRRGTLTISADVHNIGGTSYIYPIQLSDEYDFGGSDTAFANSLQLDFSAVYLDAGGVVYNSADTAAPSSIQIQYTNSLSGDTGVLVYSYSVIFTKPY